MPLYLDTQLSFAFKRKEKKKINARNEKLPAANSRPWPEQKDKRYELLHGCSYYEWTGSRFILAASSHTHTHILHFGRPKIIWLHWREVDIWNLFSFVASEKTLSLQLFFWCPPIPLERNYTKKKIIYGLLKLALVFMPLNDFG